MEKTIDKHKKHLLDIMDSMPDDACGDWRDSLAYAIDTMRKYQQLRADYENRLKDDMVAMLRFLWNDIENLDAPICDYASSDCISKWQVHEIIQQKINAIKAESEE